MFRKVSLNLPAKTLSLLPNIVKGFGKIKDWCSFIYGFIAMDLMTICNCHIFLQTAAKAQDYFDKIFLVVLQRVLRTHSRF